MAKPKRKPDEPSEWLRGLTPLPTLPKGEVRVGPSDTERLDALLRWAGSIELVLFIPQLVSVVIRTRRDIDKLLREEGKRVKS